LTEDHFDAILDRDGEYGDYKLPVMFFEKWALPATPKLSSQALLTYAGRKEIQHEEEKVQRPKDNDGTTKFHISGMSLMDIDEEED
jgi:hypothetical protein